MRNWIVILISMFILTGCDSLRFAPGEEMKQNAWLHERSTNLAAKIANDENVSQQLQAVTELNAVQSKAFVLDYGLPKERPVAGSIEDILSDDNRQIAQTSVTMSALRPDAWEVADGVIDLGIGVAGLLGGVWGIRIASALRDARQKSQALKEVIQGNELFMRQHGQSADSFKTAQRNQSPQTRTVVARVKNEGT